MIIWIQTETSATTYLITEAKAKNEIDEANNKQKSHSTTIVTIKMHLLIQNILHAINRYTIDK